jgi:hypothetical protein
MSTADGVADLELTFLTSDGSPEQLRWVRMRPLVGHPLVEPRAGMRSAP